MFGAVAGRSASPRIKGAATIGSAPRISPFGDGPSASPGPGAYTPRGHHCGENGKKTTFGARGRTAVFTPSPHVQTPGPAAYDVKAPNQFRPEEEVKPFAAASQCTFGTRNKPGKPPAADVPGPGAYAPSPVPDIAPTTKFAPLPSAFGYAVDSQKRPVSPRLQLPSNLTPGPGAYQPQASAALSPGPAFSLSSRPPRPQPADGPGPGAYNMPATEEGPSITLKSRIELVPDHFHNPGPGSYASPAFSEPASIAWFPGRIGCTLFRLRYTVSAHDSPTSERAPAFSFGCPLPPRDPHRDNPGPGEYEVLL